MYYLIEINGQMISGALITKFPPKQSFCECVSGAGKRGEPKGEVLKITPINEAELLKGAGIDVIDAAMLDENQIIRKYLDNLKTK